MTLRIDISPELEARLKSEASQYGVDEEEYARQLIEKNLAPASPVRDQATLDLLAQWDSFGRIREGVDCRLRIRKSLMPM